mmetsp:Transcript_12217/g.33351  ORF Transcript_12217/g.33351 Transcript_12217/m.33351 type:complete len:94 (-) Transcript_12217:32-313(-)
MPTLNGSCRAKSNALPPRSGAFQEPRLKRVMPPKGLGARKGAATPCVYALRIRPAPRWQLPALTPMARQPRITEQRCQFPERKDYKHGERLQA